MRTPAPEMRALSLDFHRDMSRILQAGLRETRRLRTPGSSHSLLIFFWPITSVVFVYCGDRGALNWGVAVLGVADEFFHRIRHS